MKDISVRDHKTKEHSKVLVIVMFLWLVLNGVTLFPITIERMIALRSFYLIGMVFYMAYKSGGLLYIIFDGDYEKIMLLAFGANLCGFIGRMLLEYGESTFMEALTLVNVIVYLLFIPLIVELAAYLEGVRRRKCI